MATKQSKTTMKYIQNRDIKQFAGDAVVVGCSNHNSLCKDKKLFHPDESNFYSIDLKQDEKPDLVFNVTEILPQEFKSRFKLTVLESLDRLAYNEPVDARTKSLNGAQGFQNIWDMTAQDGFILIVGCPRQKEFRNDLYLHELKYIELDEKNECILIPKNQALSINEIQESLAKIEPYMASAINNAKTYDKSMPKEPFAFCELTYKDLDSLYKTSLNTVSPQKQIQKNSPKPIIETAPTYEGNDFMANYGKHFTANHGVIPQPTMETIPPSTMETTTSNVESASLSSEEVKEPIEQDLFERFRKIYNALYDGQTSIFKKHTRYTNIDSVNEFVKLNPQSREAEALRLAKKFTQINAYDKELIYDIHQYSLANSSSFGLFKKTRVQTSSDIEPDLKEHSRTAKIIRALKN